MNQESQPFDKSRLLEAKKRLEAEIRSYPYGYLRNEDRIRPLTSALDHFVARSGVARMLASSEIERVWNAALGRDRANMTSLGAVRRGVLDVTVGNSVLLEELKLFRKAELLKAIRACSAGSGVRDLRFRIGRVEPADKFPVSDRPTKPGEPRRDRT
jgi:predicted nucleic acid-binding Zn ribbon protein